MPKPIARQGSRNAQFSRRHPADLVSRNLCAGVLVVIDFPATAQCPSHQVSVRMEASRVRFSLGSSTRETIAVRQGMALAHVEGIWRGLRGAADPLSHRQTVGLAGDIYRTFIALHAEEPGSPAAWAAVKGFNRAVQEGRAVPLDRIPELALRAIGQRDVTAAVMAFGDNLTSGINALPKPLAGPSYDALERRFGAVTDYVLGNHRLRIDATARQRLLVQVGHASTDAAFVLKRNALGDYSPDPAAMRFPTYETGHSIAAKIGGLSWPTLIELWSTQNAAANKAASTRKQWEALLKRFAAWIDKAPEQVTRRDVINWIDKRKASGISPATLQTQDLACLRSAFRVGIDDERFPASFVSPTTSVSVPQRTGAGQGEVSQRGYTDAETTVVVHAVLAGNNIKRRWMLLLLVATGARAGEIGKLRACDIRKIEGHWCIDITNDVGRVKNINSIRSVVIHPALLAAGFLEFVAKHDASDWLFVRRSRNASERPGTTAVNKLADWIKTIPGITIGRRVGLAPCHGFRHAFKTRGRLCGIASETLDAICGHEPSTVGATYGNVPVPVIGNAIAKMPVPGL